MRRFVRTMLALGIGAVVIAAPVVMDDKEVNADPGEGIEINSTNFPDPNFMNYVDYCLDGDGYIFPEEIANIKDIDCSGMGITDLTGIEYFTELERLDCSDNNIETLDLRSNTKLQYVYCQINSIKTINVSTLTELRTLICYSNNITTLDVTHNGKLQDLYAGGNNISSIDLSGNPEIYYIQLYDNKLESIDLSQTPDLRLIDISNNPMKTLDVSDNPDLTDLRCRNLKLTELDVTGNTQLQYLECTGNSIKKLDLRNHSELKHLICNENKLTALDVSGCPALYELQCQDNSIRMLTIYKNPKLIDVYKNGTKLDLEPAATAYYDGVWPVLDYTTTALAFDNSVELLLVKPTATPTPTEAPATPTPTEAPATPTTKPATATPTSKPATPTPKPSNDDGGSTPSSRDIGLGLFIERLYTVALGRASDPAGKADWFDRVRTQGYTGADLARGFLFSDEFLSKNMSNSEFVDVMYATFFDRPADSHKADWLALMDSGWTKTQVIDGFINSTEWANLCLIYGIYSGSTCRPNFVVAPSQEIIDFATRLYTTCLGRKPDEHGLEDWATRLVSMQISGSEAAHGFFFSPEFLDLNLSDSEYVTRLYRTFMDREPDPAGFADWTTQLASGVSREKVFEGFANSQEWAEICADYGILK